MKNGEMRTRTLFCGIVILLTSSASASVDLDSLQGADNFQIAAKFYQSGQYDSAAAHYYSASKQFLRIGHWATALECLNSCADADIRLMRLDAALPVLREAISISQHLPPGRELLLSQTFTLLGYLYTYEDLADSAIAVINRALQIRRETLGEDHQSVAATLYTLGLALKKKGDYEGSVAQLSEALKIQRSSGARDTVALANTLMMLGTVRIAESRFLSALSDLKDAENWLAPNGNAHRQAIASCNFYLGMTNYALGDFSEALRNYNLALQENLRISGEESPAVASIYVKIGDVYNSQGDSPNAVRFYQKGLALSIKLVGEAHSGVGEIYERLADAYSDEGELSQSLEYGLRALDTRKRALGAHHPEVGLEHENVGDIYVRCRSYELALKHYRMALDIQTGIKYVNANVLLGRVYSKIGHVFQRSRIPDSASTYLSQAIRLLSTSADANPHDVASAHEWLGRLFNQRHEYQRAIKSYDNAIVCLRFSKITAHSSGSQLAGRGFAEDLIRIISEKAEALSCTEDPNETFETCKSAWGLIDSLRRQFTSEKSKMILGEQTRSLYDNAVDASLLNYLASRDSIHIEDLFESVERGKMNVLIDAVQEARASRFAGVPEGLLNAERELETRLAFFESQRDLGGRNRLQSDSTRVAFYRDRSFASHQYLNHLRDSLSAVYPEYGSLRFGAKRPRMEDIRSALDKRTCLLEYYMTRKSIVVFMIGQDSVTINPIPIPRGFAALVEDFCKGIRTMDEEGLGRMGARLSKILLSPLKGRKDDINHLVIVPDGPLFYLPFEALPLHINGNNDSRYLIHQCGVRYSYSATFFCGELSRRKVRLEPGASFLGFAPIDPSGTPSDRTFSRIEGRRLTTGRSLVPQSSSQTLQTPLPYSMKEVKGVAELFTRHGLPARVFFAEDATEQNFKREAPHYSVIHVATHTVIDTKRPHLSSLIFASPADGSSENGGVLLAGETYAINLRADLLVLSSCESGIGALTLGEGMIALTRGFLYAGARNLVVSLWKVADRPTSDFMQLFYARLLNGESFDAALRESKLGMLANEATAAPRNWAAFTLLGY